ncbi:MAG: twin-arginine translocase TatA/TatE family subunit [Bdellovibrionales bacterium]
MNLGPMELVALLAIALLLFGPSRLPGLGRSLGDAIRGFKKGMEGEEDKDASHTPKEQIVSSAQETTKTEEKHKDKV